LLVIFLGKRIRLATAVIMVASQYGVPALTHREIERQRQTDASVPPTPEQRMGRVREATDRSLMRMHTHAHVHLVHPCNVRC
jgi:hypothetical protein